MVLTVARLEEQKGLEHLVEAAALIPDVVFVIAGEGSRRAPLEARAQALGVHDRLVFLGYRQDVPDLLACCTVFVLPSLFEGLPLAVLEAMGAGRPVVATRIGGTDEIITDGYTGLLVPPRDSVALARAIRRVLSDTDLARRLGKAGQRRALYEFSAERMAAQVTHIYDELLHSHEMHA
jgi:glycosyltransferase involved in cell wall biosynthesis